MDFNTEEPSTNGIEVDKVELTAEDAKDPWKIKDKKFFTSVEEAEEQILKSTAQYVMKQKKLDPENNTESNVQGYPNLETLNIPEAEEDNATTLAKITIFYCYFKTFLFLSHLFLCYFIWN